MVVYCVKLLVNEEKNLVRSLTTHHIKFDILLLFRILHTGFDIPLKKNPTPENTNKQQTTQSMSPKLKNYSKSYGILMQILAKHICFFLTVVCNKLDGTVSMSLGASPGLGPRPCRVGFV